MLVRRWVHELTFKNLEQCVTAARREAPGCEFSRSATVAETPLF